MLILFAVGVVGRFLILPMYFGPLPRPLSNTLPSRALLPPGPPVWSEWLPSTWIWSLWLLPWSRPTEYYGPLPLPSELWPLSWLE